MKIVVGKLIPRPQVRILSGPQILIFTHKTNKDVEEELEQDQRPTMAR